MRTNRRQSADSKYANRAPTSAKYRSCQPSLNRRASEPDVGAALTDCLRSAPACRTVQSASAASDDGEIGAELDAKVPMPGWAEAGEGRAGDRCWLDEADRSNSVCVLHVHGDQRVAADIFVRAERYVTSSSTALHVESESRRRFFSNIFRFLNPIFYVYFLDI